VYLSHLDSFLLVVSSGLRLLRQDRHLSVTVIRVRLFKRSWHVGTGVVDEDSNLWRAGEWESAKKRRERQVETRTVLDEEDNLFRQKHQRET
jgi:hypothetical protein